MTRHQLPGHGRWRSNRSGQPMSSPSSTETADELTPAVGSKSSEAKGSGLTRHCGIDPATGHCQRQPTFSP